MSAGNVNINLINTGLVNLRSAARIYPFLQTCGRHVINEVKLVKLYGNS